MAEAAGHPIDLTRLNGPVWIAASQEAMEGRYEAMAIQIVAALI